MSKLLLVVSVILVSELSCLKLQSPKELEELNVYPSLVTGSATIGGSLEQSFTPDMQSKYSTVAGKGCTGACNIKSTDKGTNFYTCNKPECPEASKRTAVSGNIKVEESQKRGAGMYVKAGSIASTSVKLDEITVKNVGMVLATEYQDRENVKAQMTLSMTPNTPDNIVAQMAAQKLIEKNQFSFYAGSGKNFLTIGESLDYLCEGTAVKYAQSSSGQKWATEIDDIKADKDETAFDILIAGGKPSFVYDINVLGILMPKSYLDKFI